MVRPSLRDSQPIAAAQREPGDAGGRVDAGGHGKAVRLGRRVDVGEQRAGLDTGGAGSGVDRDMLHGREIEHQPAVADGIPADIVAAALDRGEQPMLGGKADRAGDIGGGPAAHDEARPAVDHGVPDGPRLVIAGIAGGDGIAVEPLAQAGEHTCVEAFRAGVEGR